MTAINILLACLGGGITVIVVVGMILLTPGGTEHDVQRPVEQSQSLQKPAIGRRPAVVTDPAVRPEPGIVAAHADATRSAPQPTDPTA